MIWAGGIRYPEGTACARRVGLVAAGLREHGVRALVLLTGPSGRPGEAPDSERGVAFAVPFLRTTGSRRPPAARVARVLVELGGLVRGLAWVARERRLGRLAVIYGYSVPAHPTWRHLALVAGARLTRVPLVVDVCELPWNAAQARPSLLARALSPVVGASGVAVISAPLRDWAESESRGRGRPVRVAVVPALTDVDEGQDAGGSRRGGAAGRRVRGVGRVGRGCAVRGPRHAHGVA